jgi:hypothetical protein
MVIISPMSRAAKVAVIVVVAIVLVGAVFAVYYAAQILSKNDVALAKNSVIQYLATLTPAPPAKPDVAPVAPAKPDVKPLVSSITSADMANPCRMLLKGFSRDFTKADLACLKSPDTFKGIAVTPDQAARFCYGISEVNPAVGMECFSGMYRKVLREIRPNERSLDFVASSK